MRISIILLIIIFLLIGAYIIKSSYDLSFENKNDVKTFLSGFGSWLLQLGKNVKDVTGYAVQKKWLPLINQTIDNNKTIVKYIN